MAIGARVCLLVLLLLGRNPVAAPPGLEAIHRSYEEGDFDVTLQLIHEYRASPAPRSRGDSAFLAKHLAVIHAANPLTVEKGKHWMHELLKLDPGADLADMYVNEEIDRLFDKVRAETSVKRMPLESPTPPLGGSAPAPNGNRVGPDSAARTAGGSAPSGEGHPRRRGARAFWMAGGLVATSVGAVTAYYLLRSGSEDGRGRDREILIPKDKGGP